MTKKDERLFNPKRVYKKGSLKFIIIGFAVFIVVFGSAAFVYLSAKIDNFGLDKIMTLFERDGEKDGEAVTESDGATFLCMSVSNDVTLESGDREIYFLVLAHMDLKKNVVKFCPLNVKQSYIDSYKYGGANQVASLLEKEYNIKIDRYISSNENTFVLAINYLGGVSFNISDRIEYRTEDLTLILTPGKQTIRGESLIKYLKYLRTNDLHMQGDVFCAMINDFITEKNMERAMTLYRGVIGELDANSNITFVDTADHLHEIEALASKNGQKALTVSDVSELF